MFQPIPRNETKKLDTPPAEFERICQNAARQSNIRNAKLGFPAVSCEVGQIVFSSPESVRAEFAAEAEPSSLNASN